MPVDLGSICSDAFFNASQSWDAPRPEFTNCFCKISTAIPSALLIALSIPYVIYLASFKRVTVRWSWLLSAKAVTGALLATAVLLDLLKAASKESSGEAPDLIFYISPAVLVLAFIISIVLHVIEQSRLVGASAVLFTFYISSLLTAVPAAYTNINSIVDEQLVSDVYSTCTLTAYIALLLIQVILSCVFDKSLLTIEGNNANNTFAEFRSSIISRLTFSWLDKTVLSAYRKEITEEDVAQLDPSLCVDTVYNEFDRVFTKDYTVGNNNNSSNNNSMRNSINRDNPLMSNRINSDTDQLVDNEESEPSPAAASRDEIKRSGLLISIIKAFGGQILLSWLIMMVHGLVVFINPFLLNSLINFVTNNEQMWHGYLYTVLFFIVAIVASVTFHSGFQISLTSGIKIRSALIAAVYRKSLTLTQESRARSTVGEIVNLMTVDANKISDAIPFFWCIAVAPVQIAIALLMLWNQLGTAVLAGISVFVVLLPINFFVMAKTQKLEEKEMETKDVRIKQLNEVINAMRVIKLYAWEPSFLLKINAVRKKELGYLAGVSYFFVCVIIIWIITPFLVMLITFITYIYTGTDHVLTANKAFVSLTLFNILRFPIMVLPWTITESVNSYVSIKRIQKFLFEDDIDDSSVLRLPATNSNEPAVDIQQASFAWKAESKEEPLLNDINLGIKRGKLVAIVGKVGCGKSSLLQSVLGETVKLNGCVTTRGTVAYVPQEAWIQNLSVKDNILFGKPLNQQQYDQVISICQLEKDLQLLSAGDATEIGERGINLSGGQKQRVSLARAIYQNCDTYLLDDPLAAVDSHVGKKLFNDVISNDGQLAGKTRILVTHGIHWLPHVDEIIVIDNHTVSECGTYDELLSHNGAFAKFLREFFIEDQHRQSRSRDVSQSAAAAAAAGEQEEGGGEEEGEEEEEDEEVKAAKAQILQRLVSQTGSLNSGDGSVRSDDQQLRPRRVSRQQSLTVNTANNDNSDNKDKPNNNNNNNNNNDGRLIEDEGVESGGVSYKSYIFYIVARGVVLFALTALTYTAYTVVNVMSSIWLSQWTSDARIVNASQYISSNSSAELREVNNYYLSRYSAFGACIFVLVGIFGLLGTYSSLRASRTIHDSLLSSLLRAPMSFFDTTPTGRIVNRFSKDMEVVDRELPMVISDFIECLMITLSCIVVIAYTTPIFLTAVIPLSVIYAGVQIFYLPLSRQSRRLDSKTRSPILTNFSESIAGAAVIRAFNQQDRFVDISDARVDNNSRFYFIKLASNRWLGFRLEFLGNIAVVIATLLSVLGRDNLPPGLVGLSISFALQISDSLNWLVRQLTELETDSVAVERLNEYSSLDSEADWENQSQPIDGWPTEGRLQFCNYSTRYRQGLDLVLNGISLTLQPGHRVGIVGRTGAGKSSLTLALFRIIEASFGHIEIDGVRIDRLGLHALRSALTILPQDPTVFSGTLRSNLDPFDQKSDAELWLALDTAHLSDWVRSLSEGLQHECGEGGVNLSVGQRQLVCLARALLRKSRLLVLDEATAAVDLQTDSLIMQTIRQQFSHATVLIIAHRLATIMDADQVLVLDAGKVREFDSPSKLLHDSQSYFHFLAREANLLPAASQ